MEDNLRDKTGRGVYDLRAYLKMTQRRDGHNLNHNGSLDGGTCWNSNLEVGWTRTEWKESKVFLQCLAWATQRKVLLLIKTGEMQLCGKRNQKFNSGHAHLKVPIYRDTEKRFPKGEGVGGRMEWVVRVNRCKLLYTGWINKKVLLYPISNILW